MRTPSRGSLAALALALCSLLPASPARAATACTSVSGTAIPFAYSCKHVKFSSLPLHFAVNTLSAPVAIRSSAIAATAAAAAEWNQAWPLPTGDGLSCALICISATSTTSTGAGTISWGDPADCGVPGALAVWCPLTTQTAPDGTTRILTAQIIVNDSYTWDWPLTTSTDGKAAKGAVLGPFGQVGTSWYDLQSALAHELGHSFGLDHFGHKPAFPSGDLTNGDATQFNEVMYSALWHGSTDKRTLGAGDVTALNLDAQETLGDP